MNDCTADLRLFVSTAQTVRLQNKDNPEILFALCADFERQALVLASLIDGMHRAHDEVRINLLESEQEWHRLFRETKSPHHFVPSMQQIATTHGWELKGLDND